VVIKNEVDVINYRQSGERLKINSRRLQYSDPKLIKNNQYYYKFKNEYSKYVDFLKDKKEKTTQLGNLKSLYNAISREILRQKEMQYLSLLTKDEDYFYLVLLDKEYNKTERAVEGLKAEAKTSEWQMLDYHKITFKAVEKLALLDASTFDIDDPILQNEARSLWKNYKAKMFKEYKNNRALQGLYGYQKDQKREELRKEELVKIIDFVQRVIEKLPESKNYKFSFRQPAEYETLEEFADEIDKQGYASKWIDINKQKLFELENIEGKNVLVFKLHNKDYRKKKQSLTNGRDEKERKLNLFTKYWIDAMKLGEEIRLTPEIDIFRRKKEESESTIRILKTSNKEVVGKARNYQDKLYGVFRLEFYPTKKSSFEEVNQKVTFNKNIYYLGLDRGEKSLVSWCLIDSKGQLIKNGDWTIFKGVSYADKLKQFYDDSRKDKHGNKIQSIKTQLQEAYAVVADEVDKNKKAGYLNEAHELEKNFDVQNLLATESIKIGYCSYLINEINQILKEYPSTYIILEDLDIKEKVKDDETINNKIQNLEKTLGGTVYQAIENAIINKFKYYVIKDNQEYDGLQLVPNIVKVEDLRVVENISDKNKFGKVKWVKSKEKVGNILFVDEYLTSDECPSCGFNKCKVNISTLAIVDNQSDFIVSNGNTVYHFSKTYFKDSLGTKFDNNKINGNTDGNKSLFSVRMKKNDFSKGTFEKKDFIYCPKCQFSSNNNLINKKLFVQNESGEVTAQIKSGDDIAAYNIAKKGLEKMHNLHQYPSNHIKL